MERAEARRLQPHYIESFFLEAFQRLGGPCPPARAARYEVTHVPGRGPQPRPPDRHRRAGAAALRAHRLREGPGRAAGPAAGRLRLPRPSAARRGARPHARAPPRPAATRARCWWTSRRRREPRVLFSTGARDPGRAAPTPGRQPTHRLPPVRTSSSCTERRRDLRVCGHAPYLDYRPATPTSATAIAPPARRPGLARRRLREPGDRPRHRACSAGEHLAEVRPSTLARVGEGRARGPQRLTARSTTGTTAHNVLADCRPTPASSRA